MSDGITYEDYLDEYGSLTYSNVGSSMLPLLRQGRDLFTVTKKDPGARCKVGDVVLFRRPPDRYVLHRVVKVLPDGYDMMGDNCVTKELGVPEEDVLGVMTGFVRDGRNHDVSEFGYRAYSAVRLTTTPARVLLRKAASRIKGALR